MAYSQSWLEDPSAIRGIFVEVGVYDVVSTIETVVYLSTVGYVTTDANISYSPLIRGGIEFTESLAVDGQASLSFGDIELDNINGELDQWLDPTKYVWANRSIKIYLGDPRWVCANINDIHNYFELIFDGVVNDIDSRTMTRVNLKIRDKLERLNTPLTDVKLGTYGTWADGQTNQDSIVPIVFGEVANISPMLINPALLEYSCNKGNSELLIELRDNGVPIYNSTTPGGANVTHSTGRFTLTKKLVGTLTASVQGTKDSINLSTGNLVSGTYVNNIANLIALITTQYGKQSTRFTAADLDLTNLSSFASNTQSVGAYISDTTNTLIVCQMLANSIGAQLFITRKGKLQLLRIGVPTTTLSVSIYPSDILADTLSISSRTNVVAATKLGYCKNYTTQDNLLTNIPVSHKDMFKSENEWYTKTVVDTTVQNRYKLEADTQQKETLLLVGSEAEAEATRLNNYYKVPRTVYRFMGTSKLLSLELGQEVSLVYPRFGLDAGVSGQIVSLTPKWASSTIEIEVIV